VAQDSKTVLRQPMQVDVMGDSRVAELIKERSDAEALKILRGAR